MTTDWGGGGHREENVGGEDGTRRGDPRNKTGGKKCGVTDVEKMQARGVSK